VEKWDCLAKRVQWVLVVTKERREFMVAREKLAALANQVNQVEMACLVLLVHVAFLVLQDHREL
jgi:ABC-type transporter Mla MlaB component